MSRVGKSPVKFNSTIKVNFDEVERLLSVEGPNGLITVPVHRDVNLVLHSSEIIVQSANSAQGTSQQGTCRALIGNAVHGVSKGFERKLNLVGVGYKVAADAKKITLNLGFSHTIIFDLPIGVKAEVPTQTEIIIKGCNKQVVGQVAAKIRAFRPPEPYKGKGVRYSDEVVVIKETKKK